MIYVSGGGSGIGEAVARMLVAQGRDVTAFGRGGTGTCAYDAAHIEGVISCAGSLDTPVDDCLIITVRLFETALRSASEGLVPHPICIAIAGGGVGGPPSLDLPGLYIACKGGLACYVEWFARKYPALQAFCVAPGRTATKLTNFDGAHPDVPARFICELMTGKHGHLSGSLLAAQRDDLATVRPMKMRREQTADEQMTWRGDPTP